MSLVDSSSLLTILFKWAHGQRENFVTDAFAHLLRHLLHRDRALATELLTLLAENTFTQTSIESGEVTVATQISTDEGTPDIEIRTRDALVYVEVKVGAELGEQQLERYHRLLQAEAIKRTRLVLLSLRRKNTHFDGGRYRSLRWYQVGDILREWLSRDTWQDGLSAFLVAQFYDFLKGERITMERVNWSLPEGVKALCDLREMLSAAIHQAGLKLDQGAGWDWMARGRGGIWVGLLYDNPSQLVFEVLLQEGQRAAAEALPYGAIEPDPRYGKPCWRYVVDLASEEVHFFARSSDSQMRFLEEFVEKGVEATESVRPAEAALGSDPDRGDQVS